MNRPKRVHSLQWRTLFEEVERQQAREARACRGAMIVRPGSATRSCSASSLRQSGCCTPDDPHRAARPVLVRHRTAWGKTVLVRYRAKGGKRAWNGNPQAHGAARRTIYSIENASTGLAPGGGYGSGRQPSRQRGHRMSWISYYLSSRGHCTGRIGPGSRPCGRSAAGATCHGLGAGGRQRRTDLD